MHSLTTKLTLAFLLIGILGAALVAVITTNRTRAEFDRFVESQNAEQIGLSLTSYYATTGGWGDADALLATDPRWGRIRLLDAEGNMLIGRPNDQASFTNELMLEIDGEQIGTLFTRSADARPPDFDPRRNDAFSPEARFINSVVWSSLLSAGVAAAVALVVGVLLSRGLTRPIRALTEATQQMADGTLGAQVDVTGKDEIGRLASAFNQMSQELSEVSQKRKQLTADIAHDLRTPLSILRGYMEGIKDGSLQSSPKLIGIMYEEVEHLELLVNDLRTLSLADAGELTLNKRGVDPKALLERTGLAYMMQAEQQGVGLRVEAADSLPSVAVDAERMTQVLNNLVSNALRYTADGDIVLSASAENGHVALQVRDSGSGIAPDALPHIFDRFYRADSSRQRDASGAVSSGLGLAIAQALVKAHGGDIAVRSISAETNPTASGTQFTITLPVAPA